MKRTEAENERGKADGGKEKEKSTLIRTLDTALTTIILEPIFTSTPSPKRRRMQARAKEKKNVHHCNLAIFLCLFHPLYTLFLLINFHVESPGVRGQPNNP